MCVTSFESVQATGNLDGNITFTEAEIGEAGGGIDARFTRITASGSQDDDGIKLEEFGPGGLDAQIVLSTIAANAGDGIQAEQLGEGSGLLRLRDVTFENNEDDDVNVDGVEVVTLPPTT